MTILYTLPITFTHYFHSSILNSLKIGPIQGESDKHSYCTLDAKLWKRREERIVDHLLLLRPTIICLQELSFDTINSIAFQKLAEVGYICAAFSSSQRQEIRKKTIHSNIGCAIFIQNEKIEILSSHKLSLRSFILFFLFISLLSLSKISFMIFIVTLHQ